MLCVKSNKAAGREPGRLVSEPDQGGPGSKQLPSKILPDHAHAMQDNFRQRDNIFADNDLGKLPNPRKPHRLTFLNNRFRCQVITHAQSVAIGIRSQRLSSRVDSVVLWSTPLVTEFQDRIGV